VKITFKEVEIELQLAELNHLPHHVRTKVLEHVATEADIEWQKQKLGEVSATIATTAKKKGRPKKTAEDV
jgi:hypothetical protein